MAEGKNKVVVYTDWIHIFEKLKDGEAGKLIKHFFRYVNDQNPEAPNRLTELTFEPIKQTLKRDLKAWEKKSIKNSENAKERWDKVRSDANASERKNHDANHADSETETVSGTVTDTGSDTDKKKKSESEKGIRDRAIVFKKLFGFLRKYQKKFYPAEVMRATDAMLEFQNSNGITQQLIDTDLPTREKWNKEDERIFDKHIGSGMKKDIEDMWDHYSARNFIIDGQPIINWESVIKGWIKKKPQFETKNKKH